MAEELATIVARYKEHALSIARLSAVSLSAKVVSRTPIDTGDAQNSWTPALNRIDESNTGGDYARVINSMQPGDAFTMASSLAYIRPLEYGHSPQAPKGMLRVSVAEWKQIVKAASNGN